MRQETPNPPLETTLMADVPQENPDEYVEEDTPDLMNCHIRGEPGALEKVMARHERRMLAIASRFIRCLQMGQKRGT